MHWNLATYLLLAPAFLIPPPFRFFLRPFQGGVSACLFKWSGGLTPGFSQPLCSHPHAGTHHIVIFSLFSRSVHVFPRLPRSIFSFCACRLLFPLHFLPAPYFPVPRPESPHRGAFFLKPCLPLCSPSERSQSCTFLQENNNSCFSPGLLQSSSI